MKRHKDLLAVLRANDMRITAGRRVLLQFILDNHKRRIGLREIHIHLEDEMGHVERTSVYRNLMAFQRLGIIQAFKSAKGKAFQYSLDREVHPFYICKACGNARRGSPGLFERIQKALQDVDGFARAKLSVVFYGTCAGCERS